VTPQGFNPKRERTAGLQDLAEMGAA